MKYITYFYQVFLTFCITNPNPPQLHAALEKVASGDYKVQGDILSCNTEGTYRVWLALLLTKGDTLHYNQWWKKDLAAVTMVKPVVLAVKGERENEAYVTALNKEVVALLHIYAPPQDEGAGAGAGAGAADEDNMEEDNMYD